MMMDVREFTNVVLEDFKARYPKRFDGSEDSEFTEDLARMMALIAAIAIDRYDRENRR